MLIWSQTVRDQGCFMKPIITRADALRHTAMRITIATCATVAMTLIMIGLTYGTDPTLEVSLSSVAVHGVMFGAIISTLVAGVLTYRSSLLMKDLNLARAELLRISHTDQLTGLLNRRGYDHAAERALASAIDANVPAVALMCDIDRFKAINDEFGHEFGDKVLVEISEAIRSFGEQNAMLVGRHGGEEFAALMIGVTVEQAVQRANALRRICAATEISHKDGASAKVTVSIGLASSRQEANLPEMMRTADQALYQAKHGGRNRVARADIGANPWPHGKQARASAVL
jgi:diguanylate cyclase (GGDEF)-like protein